MTTREQSALIHASEVDGVPLFWADLPGPTTATLAFRTGFADEPLAATGWTHAAEHLVLSQIGYRQPQNGSVDLGSTRFAVEASGSDLVEWFERLCTGLGTLSPERLEQEKRVLELEAEQASVSVADRLLRYRFGDRGLGAAARGEWGLPGLTIEALQEWAAERFVAANAVVWMTGPPPAGLRLSLPQGSRLALPSSEPLLAAGQHWVVDALPGAALSLLIEETCDPRAFTSALREQLFRTLRLAEALAYSPQVSVRRLPTGASLLTALADSRSADHERVARLLVDIAREVAGSGHARQEAAVEDGPVSEAELANQLVEGALRELYGWADTGSAPSDAGLISAVDNALLGVHTPAAGLAAMPGARDARLGYPTGAVGEVLYEGRQDEDRLVVGQDGIRLDKNGSETIAWAHVCGVAAYEDDLRLIFGPPGITIRVAVELWPENAELAGLIDRLAPAGSVAPQGPQPPSQLGQAEANLARALRERSEARARWVATRRRLLRAAPLILGLVVAFLVVLGGIFMGLYALFGTRGVTYISIFLLVLIVALVREARKNPSESSGVSTESTEQHPG